MVLFKFLPFQPLLP